MKLGRFMLRRIYAVDATFVVLIGFDNYRARLDVRRSTRHEDSWYETTKLHIWENRQYGIFSPIREIYQRVWVHQ